MKKYFKRMRARHWAWMSFLFFSGVAWPTFMLLTPPELVTDILDPTVLFAAMVISLIGTLVTMFGYFASQQVGKLGVIGVSLELSGLSLSVLGPAAYLITRVYEWFTPDSDGLTSAVLFTCSVLAVYIYRFVIVIPRFRFEAHDPNKE